MKGNYIHEYSAQHPFFGINVDRLQGREPHGDGDFPAPLYRSGASQVVPVRRPRQKMVLSAPPDGRLRCSNEDNSLTDAALKQTGVNCAVFRNEGEQLSSFLIGRAQKLARQRWPGERLYTYVDPRKTRHKRDPGRCFRRAGWRPCGETKGGLQILEAL